MDAESRHFSVTDSGLCPFIIYGGLSHDFHFQTLVPEVFSLVLGFTSTLVENDSKLTLNRSLCPCIILLYFLRKSHNNTFTFREENLSILAASQLYGILESHRLVVELPYCSQRTYNLQYHAEALVLLEWFIAFCIQSHPLFKYI